MTRRTLSLLAITATLALDPLLSITDAQDGNAGSAPGEAPRPDVAPRAALLTGDVVADATVGDFLMHVERGADGHARLVAKTQNGHAASALVEVHCLRAEGSLASRMGPRETEVAVQRVRVDVPEGGSRTVALNQEVPAPAAQDGDPSPTNFFAARSWWQFRLQLVAEHADPNAYWPTVVLVSAPTPSPSSPAKS